MDEWYQFRAVIANAQSSGRAIRFRLRSGPESWEIPLAVFPKIDGDFFVWGNGDGAVRLDSISAMWPDQGES